MAHSSWTYSGDPSTSKKDEVRFLIQDTDEENQLVSDQEIHYTIETEGTALKAAASLCEILSARFATAAEFSLGDYSVNLGDLSEKYERIWNNLRSRIARQSAMPYAGGIKVGDKQARERNPNRADPFFERDLTDYPGTGDER